MTVLVDNTTEEESEEEEREEEEKKVVTPRLFASLDMGHCPLLAHVTQSLYALQHLHIRHHFRSSNSNSSG